MKLDKYLDTIERKFNGSCIKRLTVDVNILLIDNNLVVTNQNTGNKLRIKFTKENEK